MAHREIPVARGPQLLPRPPRQRNRWKLAAILLLVATIALATALVGSWLWFRHLALVTPQPIAPSPEQPKVLTPAPVTPLLLQYKLDLPGRGEIFPAMSSAARDYWPVAILTISNSAERPALQVVTARVAEGSIGAQWNARVSAIEPHAVVVTGPFGERRIAAERVYTMIGYMPETGLLEQLGVPLDPQTGIPAHDPATMETSVPGVFIAGVLASGFDANKTFIENGRGHGELIVGRLAMTLR